jgi:hypothetical protein
VLCVDSLRKISLGKDRVFAVYDTALKSNRAHAELAMTNVPDPATMTKNERKKERATLRKQLLDACLHDGRVLSEDQVFEHSE